MQPIDLNRYLDVYSTGKVRDTYFLRGGFPDLRLQVASNRISIFDFVLGPMIPGKGQCLTATTVFSLTKVLKDIMPNHLVAYGAEIDRYLPRKLRGNMDLQSRALVVRKLNMLPVECVVRGYLAGGDLKDYRKSGQICGHKLPPGLYDGCKLPQPIFTPSTKETEGHDVNISAEWVRAKYGPGPEELSLTLYKRAAEFANQRGIIIADTKFEMSTDFVLADEVLTSDSSRIWLVSDWEESQQKPESPIGFDKQFVREYGKTVATPFVDDQGVRIVGIDKLNPENEEHRAFVRQHQLPEDVIKQTTRLYLKGFEMLVGYDITTFQDRDMGLKYTTR